MCGQTAAYCWGSTAEEEEGEEEEAHALKLTGSGSGLVVVKGRVFVCEVEEVCLAPVTV